MDKHKYLVRLLPLLTKVRVSLRRQNEESHICLCQLQRWSTNPSWSVSLKHAPLFWHFVMTVRVCSVVGLFGS